MSNPFEKEGMFSWFELMTDDVNGAKKFYKEVLDWEFIQDTNNKDYTLVKAKGVDHPIAGMFDRKSAIVDNPESIPPHWGNYITVKDIQKALESVQRLGGTVIVDATEIPKVGTFSVIQDPQGAVISLMQYMAVGNEACEV